ncbi:MAG: folylpolyglutamate synthase/dihydrofolate synthase family protein [Saprospiraceae bacterium]
MNRFTKYEDVLKYMFDQLPMYQRLGAPAYKKDLTNTLLLMEITGQPHQSFKSIHIAGTNGKGSTSHLISGGLQAQGYKVGLYTSPHYKDFRERIKINGVYIKSSYIKYFINTYYDDLEKIKPSFFEMTVALAFSWFRQQKVDFAVIETGLGGRLDSTNVITPIVSIITNISFDHQNMLGDTLPKIAIEKAGIIKSNVPVIIGEYQEEVNSVFEKTAEAKLAPLIYAQKLIQVTQSNPSVYAIRHGSDTWFPSLPIDMNGPFQENNLVTAMATLHFLKNTINWSDQKIVSFFPRLSQHTGFMGRWQILSTEPLILTDSAHNEAGLRYIIEFLEQQKRGKCHILLGFVNDKDIGKLLHLFPLNATYYFAKANIPRGLPSKELKELANSFGLRGKAYSSVKRAFSVAKKALKKEDVLFVGGSIFVVAEIL